LIRSDKDRVRQDVDVGKEEPDRHDCGSICLSAFCAGGATCLRMGTTKDSSRWPIHRTSALFHTCQISRLVSAVYPCNILLCKGARENATKVLRRQAPGSRDNSSGMTGAKGMVDKGSTEYRRRRAPSRLEGYLNNRRYSGIPLEILRLDRHVYIQG
jgi:hypothetical protein